MGQDPKNYKSQLLKIAKENGVLDNLQILNRKQYAELPKVTRENHIGLAIHEDVGSIYGSGGTASNKIYEYAALGLPVMLHGNPHYQKYLSRFEWAFFVQLSNASILKSLSEIVDNYEGLSKQAHSDFNKTLHYEAQFSRVFDTVLQLIKN